MSSASMAERSGSALSANATIANDDDSGRAGPPAPKIAIVTCADPRLTNIEQSSQDRGVSR